MEDYYTDYSSSENKGMKKTSRHKRRKRRDRNADIAVELGKLQATVAALAADKERTEKENNELTRRNQTLERQANKKSCLNRCEELDCDDCSAAKFISIIALTLVLVGIPAGIITVGVIAEKNDLCSYANLPTWLIVYGVVAIIWALFLPAVFKARSKINNDRKNDCCDWYGDVEKWEAVSMFVFVVLSIFLFVWVFSKSGDIFPQRFEKDLNGECDIRIYNTAFILLVSICIFTGVTFFCGCCGLLLCLPFEAIIEDLL